MTVLRMSLTRFMLAISLAVCLVAVAAYSWRAVTQPDISFEIVLEVSENYSPPPLRSSDIADMVSQMIPNPTESDRSTISAMIANTSARVLPYGTNATQIVVTGKSWQTEPASLELLARAVAQLITRDAANRHGAAMVTSKISSQGRSIVPKTILADYDRSKR